MSAIEQKARELLAAAYREMEYPAMVHESHNLMHGRPERRERAALAAIIAALTPPEGFVLVPVEPTEAMVDAGRECGSKFVYERMIAARPEGP